MWQVYARMLGVVLVVVASIPFIWSAKRFCGATLYEAAVKTTYRIVAWCMGLKVTVRGAPAAQRPLLLVSNHISYLDILAYGSTLPVVFTPKSEIANWPIIGTMCRLLGCVFIERKAVKTAKNMDGISKALAGSYPVLLFAEGTTGDAKRILPIRSSYFSITKVGEESADVWVQPVLLRYTKMHGLPLDSTTKPMVAWYGDMELLPHLKGLLQRIPIQAEIEFYPAVSAQCFANRKELAAHVQSVLVAGQQNLR
jgi:lyso-ornithine lipid O-acyltransferase